MPCINTQILPRENTLSKNYQAIPQIFQLYLSHTAESDHVHKNSKRYSYTTVMNEDMST